MESQLRLYFQHYIEDVRKLKSSTALHYIDALNNISRRPKAVGLVQEDIYEIRDLDALAKVREFLLNDGDFISLNKRGNSMYSAGLNNYIKFAEGADFKLVISNAGIMDIPVPVKFEKKYTANRWERSNIIRVQAIEMAGHKCELNASHETFIARSDQKPYMEGHHAIPLRYQSEFMNSLDVYANVLCLCPTCHRMLHHGFDSERRHVLDYVYGVRQHRLAVSGIGISRNDFLSLATK